MNIESGLKKRVVQVAVGTMAALAVAVVPAAGTNPARAATPTLASDAAVTCYGDYCSGMDPAETGCAADAITVAAVQVDTGAGRLELRWSPTCKTNWARWQQYPVGWCLSCKPLALSARQDTGYSQSLSFFDDGVSVVQGETYWSPMIYSPERLVEAIVDIPCGGMGLLATAVDCGMNGQIKTAAG